MEQEISSAFHLSSQVANALSNHSPLVALETTVITHGLPSPQNLEFAKDAETIVKDQGVVPATTALLAGKVMVGLKKEELVELVASSNPTKVSSRNLGICIAQKRSGGTTVAGTLVICRTIGIQVFATGGIGGVHRGSHFDISADLDELARSPVIVVCAGAKSILDLSATLEVLETRGVPVIGYKTDEFPAFYSIKSGLPVDAVADDAASIVTIARAHWALGLKSAILVCVPPPNALSIDSKEIDEILDIAMQQADAEGITRGKITPYLLEKMNQLTSGRSLQANLALLKNNVSLGAEIANQLSAKMRLRTY
jgi:pseudouridylate synthase